MAKRMRKQQRYATNCARRFMMPGWDIGAKGTISLLDRDSRELRPLSDFAREWVCCGNVHGDRICGSRVDDLKWCLLCWDYENEVRWLCKCCRRTDVKSRRYPDAGICRLCPAEQRKQGGRKPLA